MQSIPKPEFPRPERQREHWQNLNGVWDFQLFPEGEEVKEAAFAKERAAYETTIQVPFSWVCPLSQVEENVAGVGWYRREAVYEGRADRIFLCFGAVDYRADVYVNGTLAGSHVGGYSYFEIEVTALWKAGKNVIEVRAEDYRREDQLYGKQGYGDIQGIWQTVWLESRPNDYIQDFTITTRMNGEVTIAANVDAPDGATLTACFDGSAWDATVQGGQACLAMRLEAPRLWSPDTPSLYEGRLCLKNGDNADVVHTYFGIREIGIKKVGDRNFPWITLNGKPIYIQGVLDQAFHAQGHFTYPSDEEMQMEAWRVKRLGLNMARIHIKAEEPRKLYWLAKLGVLVMQDIPCFFGPPTEAARQAYEAQLPELIRRDINNPAIFAWVIFNESWGLLDREDGEKVYRPETQAWVRTMYLRAKALDPTRLVEDNSPCRWDHVQTDLNTWHFYMNGYERIRDHVQQVVDSTYPGSGFNYIGVNVQEDAPLMNSECGLVWGVEKSAGDSDLAWQYHYMLNEFRRHEKMCGFIFTELHDVVNEFNGYYRIDNTDKDFGYQDFCRGMSLRDLHAEDFLAVDGPPAQRMEAGDTATVPLSLSSFSDRYHGQACSVGWTLWHDSLEGRVTDAEGILAIPKFGYGLTALDTLAVRMPQQNAMAVLSLYLQDEKGAVISRNFVTFDVHAALPANITEVPVSQGRAQGFAPVWRALGDEKLCMGGSGQVTFDVPMPRALQDAAEILIHLEAGAKRVLPKDRRQLNGEAFDLAFMRGHQVDRGAFENSYWMTDESRFPSTIEVLIDGQPVDTLYLENDWADARGVLSWLAQPTLSWLEEAGSYGERRCIHVPSRLVPRILARGALTLTLRVHGEGGLALYGRGSGRFAHGLLLEVR